MQGIRRRSQEPDRRSAGASLSTSSLDAVTRKSYDHKLNRPAPTCPTSKDPEDKPPVSFTSLPCLVSKASLRIPSEKPPVSYQNAYRVALRSHPYPGTQGLPNQPCQQAFRILSAPQPPDFVDVISAGGSVRSKKVLIQLLITWKKWQEPLQQLRCTSQLDAHVRGGLC